VIAQVQAVVASKDDVPSDRASWVALLVRQGVAEGVAGVIYDGIVATSPGMTPSQRMRSGRAFVAQAEAARVTPERVIDEVLLQTGVRRFDFFDVGRSARLVNARTVAVAALRMRLGLSSPEIGRLLGRDHSTVLYHLHRAARTPGLLDLVEAVLAKLDGAVDQAVAS
jgi:hypothetical protein